MTPEEKRAKRNAYLAVWREKNREKTRAAQRRYYEANREVCDAKVRVCHEAKRDYYSQKAMEWQRDNYERYLETRRRSYARNSDRKSTRLNSSHT